MRLVKTTNSGRWSFWGLACTPYKIFTATQTGSKRTHVPWTAPFEPKLFFGRVLRKPRSTLRGNTRRTANPALPPYQFQ